MSDSLSIGWTRAQADGRRRSYKRLLGLNLILQTLIAVMILFWPDFSLGLVGFDSNSIGDWPRIWAGMLLLVNAFQVPGYIEPVYQRWPNVIGVIGRALMVVIYLFLGGAFLIFAAFDGLFGLLLALFYHRLILAELSTRP